MTKTTTPTTRERLVFGALFPVFFALLGFLALKKPGTLYGAGIVTGAAFVACFLLNREVPRRKQLFGVLIPGLLLGVWSLREAGIAPMTLAWGLGGIGVAGALVAWLSRAAGNSLYANWMSAAVPIGWSISHAILGFIYYVVLTPTGLIMRACGKDPMRRKLQPEATSFWIQREPASNVDRYFRQF